MSSSSSSSDDRIWRSLQLEDKPGKLGGLSEPSDRSRERGRMSSVRGSDEAGVVESAGRRRRLKPSRRRKRLGFSDGGNAGAESDGSDELERGDEDTRDDGDDGERS